MTSTDNTPSAETESATEMNDRALGNLTSEQVPQLTLHTRLGQNLFFGRKPATGQHEIVGLVRFASQVRYIWNGACHDDPYADWWLIKIDHALQITRLGQDYTDVLKDGLRKYARDRILLHYVFHRGQVVEVDNVDEASGGFGDSGRQRDERVLAR